MIAALAIAALFAAPDSIEGEWETDAAVAALSIAVHGGAWMADRAGGMPECPCDPASVPAFDRWPIGRDDDRASEASTVLQVGLVVAGPLLAASTDPGPWDERAQSTALVLEAMTLTSGATQLLKAATHRPRPYAYSDVPFGGRPYHSFPSGHTSASFAAATGAWLVWKHRHPESRATPWIAAAGYATAATVAWLRVESGRHFPSDVVAGAALGSGIAVATIEPRFHARRVTVVAAPNGLALVGRF